MPVSGKSTKPSAQAQTQFDLLMELYEKGPDLKTDALVNLINKFLTIAQPGMEKQVRWGWLFKKADRTNLIVDMVRWGMNQLREGKPFTRYGFPSHPLEMRLMQKVDDGIIWDRSTGRAARVASAEPEYLFITRVFELLTDVAPWLRLCQRTECKRFFLFQRPKQIYCSDLCAQQVRMARFLAKQKAAASGQRGRRRK